MGQARHFGSGITGGPGRLRGTRWRLWGGCVGGLGCVLLALNLLGGNLGPLSPEWSRAWAILVLWLPLAFSLRWPPRLRNGRRALAGGLVALAASALLVRQHESVLLLGLAGAVVWGLGALLAGMGGSWRGGAWCVRTAWLYGVFRLVVASTPFLGDGLVGAATAWSSWLGRSALHQPIVLAPSGLGGGVLGSLLCCLTAQAIGNWGRPNFRWRRILFAAAVLVAGNACYVWLQNCPDVFPQAALPLFLSQAVFLALGVAILGVTLRPAVTVGPFPGRNFFACAATAVFPLAAFVLASWPQTPAQRPRAVLFRDDGFVDWKRPVFGKYGPFDSGLFGNLPDYLQAAGWRSEFSPTITSNQLAGAGVVTIINPTNRWSAAELQDLWRFVEDGGSLLVLGDHTDIMGSRACLNTLLAPVNIAFNFDSGFPARPEWKDCLSALAHPVTARVGRATEAVISVGATLEIARPAFALVRGRYGFADLGNALNVQGAFLGNYRYEKGEQLGDVVLIAAARHGRGKVLVFGDTSPFQNGALAYSYFSMVEPVFQWLTAKDWPGIVAAKWLCGALLLAGAGWWLRRAASGALALASVVCVLAFALGGWTLRRQMPEPPLQGPLALMDRAHANRFSLAPLQTDSIGPLALNLLRNRFLPLLLDRWDAATLSRASVFVTTAPARAYSKSELRDLRAFAEGGGLVILNAGWEEKGAAVKGLLDEFGLDILRVPLGPYPVTRVDNHLTDQPQCVNGWPVVVTDPQLQAAFARAREKYRPPVLDEARAQRLAQLLNPLLGGRETAPPPPPAAREPVSADEPVQVLFQTSEALPIVVARVVGQGSVVAIGDTFFLGNDNLESLQFHRQGNILFLKHLFETVRRRRP